MLEQRPQTRFFSAELEGSKLTKAGSFVERLDESAVSIVFVGRDGDVGVKPNTTNSQNLSTFATSSVPYFDGLVRERATTEPDLVPDSHITLQLL